MRGPGKKNRSGKKPKNLETQRKRRKRRFFWMCRRAESPGKLRMFLRAGCTKNHDGRGIPGPALQTQKTSASSASSAFQGLGLGFGFWVLILVLIRRQLAVQFELFLRQPNQSCRIVSAFSIDNALPDFAPALNYEKTPAQLVERVFQQFGADESLFAHDDARQHLTVGFLERQLMRGGRTAARRQQGFKQRLAGQSRVNALAREDVQSHAP